MNTHPRRNGVAYAFGDPVALDALVDSAVAHTLSETPLSKDQRRTPVDDERQRLQATGPDTIELRGWLLSYGARVEVTKPGKLRGEMLDGIRAMAKRYGIR